MKRQFKLFGQSAALAAILVTTACSTTGGTVENGINDPYEQMNRKIFAFNRGFDRAILRPISSGYRAVLPKPARDGVSNVMRNLREPWVFANDLLQFKFERAGLTLSRFVINTVFGIGGLFKASDDVGIPYHSEDLGQTLATWGVGDGAYWVVPFLGASNGRDFTGFAGGIFLDPVTIYLNTENKTTLNWTRAGVDVLDARVRLHDSIDDLFAEEDPYVIMRSLYLQNREFEIHDGNPPSNEEEEDFFDSLEDEDSE